jgi:hypothetical protein
VTGVEDALAGLSNSSRITEGRGAEGVETEAEVGSASIGVLTVAEEEEELEEEEEEEGVRASGTGAGRGAEGVEVQAKAEEVVGAKETAEVPGAGGRREGFEIGAVKSIS